MSHMHKQQQHQQHKLEASCGTRGMQMRNCLCRGISGSSSDGTVSEALRTFYNVYKVELISNYQQTMISSGYYYLE
ncbi:GM24604 [Drosophila sechellia]|uniref:GM24604 n=1 Tax=Drosophila sechellia TaxID=7238 RepID=B4HGQ6_DROSE|nr:GM24604 [Drosophila sechellia]